MSKMTADIRIAIDSNRIQMHLYGKGSDITHALVRATHSSDEFALTIIAAAAVILRADTSGELSAYFDRCSEIIK